MRIDYSPPKQSYVTSQSKPRPRKEPVGLFTSMIVITGLIAFAVGFGSGWFLSERSTKKAFQAAAEQNSLENSTKQATAPPQPVQPQPAAPATPPQPAQPAEAASTTTPAPQTAPLPQLSFYKTLPGGQKSALLGSGINSRDEREKQPLQAAIPTNLARRQQAAAAPKPTPEKVAAAESSAAEKPVSSDKPAPSDRPTAATTKARGYTVQVASYNIRAEAEAMKSKLVGKGYNVIISESNQGDNGTWYRVRVGRKLEQEAAKELAGKIGKGAIAIPE